MRTKRPSTAEPVIFALLAATLGGCGVGSTAPSLPRAPAGAVAAYPLADRVLVVLLAEQEALLYNPADEQWSAPITLGDRTPTSLVTTGETLWALTSTTVQRSDDRGARWTSLAAGRETGVSALLADGGVLAVEPGAVDDAMIGGPATPWLLRPGAEAWTALPALDAVSVVWAAAPAGGGAVLLGGPASVAPDAFCAKALFFDGTTLGAPAPMPADHCPEALLGLADATALALGSSRRFEPYEPFAVRIRPDGVEALPLPGGATLGRFGAVTLNDGRVLVAGGTPWSADPDAAPAPLRETWLLAPGADAWTAGPALSVARVNPALVAWGQDVLVFGGQDADGEAVLPVERLSVGR